MGPAVFFFLLDFLIFTPAVAITASWFFTSRYLTSRTPTQLGKGDVETLRAMRDELKLLDQLDGLRMITLPEENRDRIRALVTQHDNRREPPA